MDISTLIVAGMGFIGIIVTQWLTTQREARRQRDETEASKNSFLLAQRVDAYSDMIACLASSIDEKYRDALEDPDGHVRLPPGETTLNRQRELYSSLYQAYGRVCVVGASHAVKASMKLMNAYNKPSDDFQAWLDEVNKFSAKFVSEAHQDVQGTPSEAVQGPMFERPANG